MANQSAVTCLTEAELLCHECAGETVFMHIIHTSPASTRIESTSLFQRIQQTPNMAANFFNNKARAAALTAGNAEKGKEKQGNASLQPWVEK